MGQVLDYGIPLQSHSHEETPGLSYLSLRGNSVSPKMPGMILALWERDGRLLLEAWGWW